MCTKRIKMRKLRELQLLQPELDLQLLQPKPLCELLHECPVLCTELGLQGLACLATTSSEPRGAC
jgi:hypothetical protein